MIVDGLRNLLLDDPALDTIISGRVFDTPLKRPGDDDPDLAGFEATPEAFDPLPPMFILPSIVIGEPRAGREPETGKIGTMASRWIVTLAYYTSPDARGVLEAMVWYARVAIGRRWIETPSGRDGRVIVPPITSTVVSVPEMPGSGIMTTGDVEITYVSAY